MLKNVRRVLLSSDDEDEFKKKSDKVINTINKSNKTIISDSDESEISASPTCVLKTIKNKQISNKSVESSPRKEWKGVDLKLNLKPLGFNQELAKWIKKTQNSPIISSSLTPVSIN